MSSQVEAVLSNYVFRNEDGTVQFWDHPNLKSRLIRPMTDYKPITRIEHSLDMLNNGKLSEVDMTILKVVGDAVCANENQLRRYLSMKYSSNVVGKTLRRLAKYGFVTRVKCYLEGQNEQDAPRPSAPFVLGVAGFALMKRLYSDQYFRKDQYFAEKDFSIPLYVATNEIRALAYESTHLRGWQWSPLSRLVRKVSSPNASFQIKIDEHHYDFIVSRVYQNMSFIDHLRSQLEVYRYFHKEQGRIPHLAYNEDMNQVIVFSVSSVSVAKEIQDKLGLHHFPMHVWFCIDEWITESEGLRHAFAEPRKEGLEQLDVWFLEKKMNKQ